MEMNIALRKSHLLFVKTSQQLLIRYSQCYDDTTGGIFTVVHLKFFPVPKNNTQELRYKHCVMQDPIEMAIACSAGVILERNAK